MSASFGLTNAEVVRAVLQTAGLAGRDAANMDAATEADVRAILRSGLRRGHYPEFVDERGNASAYQWRWREKHHSIPAVAIYETGTVTITGGQVTLADGAWPDDIEDYYLKVDGHVLFVTGQDTENPLVITTSHTQFTAAAGSTYKAYKYRYALPSDFGEWLGAVVYSNGDYSTLDGYSLGSRELSCAGEEELRLRYAVGLWDGYATSHYALTTTPEGDTYHVLFWPVPEPYAFIQGTYLSNPEDNLPADLTTPGSIVQVGPAYAEAFLEAILAAAEEYNDDASGVHAARFERALRTAILHDKAVGGVYDIRPRGPDYKGPGEVEGEIDWSGAI